LRDEIAKITKIVKTAREDIKKSLAVFVFLAFFAS